MSVDSSLASLYESLKVDDPWVPPRPWESIPSQSGIPRSSCRNVGSTRPRVFEDSKIISEASLVRLVMNAMQGVQSVVLSIEKLSMAFCTDPADRSFHQNLWNLSTSARALGNILLSVGYSGCVVVLLSKFVDYFASFNLNKASKTCRLESSDELNMCSAQSGVHEDEQLPCSLVNQAFAVAVRKVLNGYKSALDTLCPSIGLRRSAGGSCSPMDVSHGVGCLTNVVLSDISFLEVYLHTKELRTQIEALGSICKLNNGSACSSSSSLEDIIAMGAAGFCNFPRGGYLLSYLYQELQVADPAHCRLLKYLFVQSCGPYFSFIRSWIYKAEITDPYEEFIVDHDHSTLGCIAENNLEASFQWRDGVAVPCFLKEISVPVIRAGQQLQILRKLLELCKCACGSPSSEEILPCYEGFWSNHTSDASHLVFSKENIEALVNARNIYYCRMQEKVEKFFANLEVRHELVEPSRSGLAHFDGTASLALRSSSFLFLAEDQESSTLVVDNAFADDSSSADELPYDLDGCESPNYSSLESAHEQSKLDDLVEPAHSVPSIKHTYRSALKSLSSIASNNSLLKRQGPGNEKMNFHGSSSNLTTSFRTDHGLQPVFKLTRDGCEAVPKCFVVDQILDGPPDHRKSSYFNREFPERPCLNPGDIGVQVLKSKVKDAENLMQCLKGTVAIPHNSSEEVGTEARDEYQASLGLFTLKPLELGQDYIRLSSKLSANPMLARRTLSSFGNAVGNGNLLHGRPLPCFDFSSVGNPLKLCVEKSDAETNNGYALQKPVQNIPKASAANVRNSQYGEKGHNADSSLITSAESLYQHPTLVSNAREGLDYKNVSGGSTWETMLSSCRSKVANVISEWKEESSAYFEMPLDFVVDKCLVQEIFLQYKFVSTVTIKLLLEGFHLQGHLLSLRRYHFLEVADWADMFITSLWQQKKVFMNVQQGVSDLQGLLELSIQRSSCERDLNLDRLFIFSKGNNVPPQSTVAGIHFLNNLGLGYRIDWPINIILTPTALKMYDDIFNFLIKVKLALLSLTTVWSLLKGLKHSHRQSNKSHALVQEIKKIAIIAKLRHQLSHFVSMLQQYLQSQLSHVSWSKFLHDLQHKVKDMIDLHSVHMDYLLESLHVCFLSRETQDIAVAIQSILQSAIEFHDIVNRGVREAIDVGDPSGCKLQIDTSQVHGIKEKFMKNVRELRHIYLKSSKHGKFGLSHFWVYLNYNEFYSD